MKMYVDFLLLFMYSTILSATVQLEDLAGDKGTKYFNGKDIAECHWQIGQSVGWTYLGDMD